MQYNRTASSFTNNTGTFHCQVIKYKIFIRAGSSVHTKDFPASKLLYLNLLLRGYKPSTCSGICVALTTDFLVISFVAFFCTFSTGLSAALDGPLLLVITVSLGLGVTASFITGFWPSLLPGSFNNKHCVGKNQILNKFCNFS